jgi:hypothetical protein
VRIQVILGFVPFAAVCYNSARQQKGTPEFSDVPSRDSSGGRQVKRDSLARRIESMSIVMWKIMRRLPRPVLLVLLIFLLTPLARA